MSFDPSTLQLSAITWKRLSAELFWVYDDSVHPQGRDSITKVTWSTAWLIREGSVRVECTGDPAVGRKDQWVFPPLGKRRQIFSPDARILSVNFHAVWPSQNAFFDRPTTLIISSKDAPDLERAALKMLQSLPPHPATNLQVMRQQIDFFAYLKILRSFYDWLEVYARTVTRAGTRIVSGSAGDARIERATQLIDSYPFREGFSEEEVARQVGLSVRQLSRLFQENLGTSPARYYDKKRLNRARDLLLGASTPIKELSYELGFSSPAYFCNWFKARTGASPRAFREKGSQ